MQELIYIADDDSNIRDIISGFLKNDGFEVQAFETGDALLEAFENRTSDMVILDITMPGSDGLTICSKIRSYHNVPIVIVSARDSEIDRITGITMGGDDYLVKPFSPVELVARVKSIFRRIQLDIGTPEETPMVSFGNIHMDGNKRTCLFEGSAIDLTPTEFALMLYMMKNATRAVSREELLKNVWKFDFDADTRAIDDVLKRLRKKIVKTTVRIVSVWGFGFKLELETPA